MKKEDYMRLPKERLAELLEERDSEPRYIPSFPPLIQVEQSHPLCYEPGGICTNPFHDCINCPRLNTIGGTWSTNTSIINKEYEVKQGNDQTDFAQSISVSDERNYYKLM